MKVKVVFIYLGSHFHLVIRIGLYQSFRWEEPQVWNKQYSVEVTATSVLSFDSLALFSSSSERSHRFFFKSLNWFFMPNFQLGKMAIYLLQQFYYLRHNAWVVFTTLHTDKRHAKQMLWSATGKLDTRNKTQTWRPLTKNTVRGLFHFHKPPSSVITTTSITTTTTNVQSCRWRT